MANLNSKTTAVAANLASGFFVYAINAANSADYKVAQDVLITSMLPTQTGNANKALVTDGSGTLSWAVVDSLPTQTGNSGKYLTTNGTAASWGTVSGGGDFVNISDTALGAEATSLTVSGLDLNTDTFYKGFFIFKAGTGGSGNSIEIRINGDTTSGNYRSSYLKGDGTSPASGGAANRSLTHTSMDSTFSNKVEFEIFKGSSADSVHITLRPMRYVSASTVAADTVIYTFHYTQTTNVTSIGFNTTSGNFAVGTRLYIGKYA